MEAAELLIVLAVVCLPLLLLIAARRAVAHVRQGLLPDEDLPTREEVERIAAALRQQAGSRSRQNLADAGQCGLCLEERLAAPVELLPCGHIYCNTCVLRLWTHTGRHRRILCPYCRSPVEAVFPAYALREAAAAAGHGGNNGEADLQCDRQLHALNAHPAFAARATVRTKLILFLRGVANVRLLPRLIQIKMLLSFALVLIYTVMPLDLIPDYLGLLGLLDDLVLMGLMLAIVVNVLVSVLA
jgi:uncharacterized membrane protein YkvA (DUF1232 family)